MTDETNIIAGKQFLTFTLAGQLFGVPVLEVNDVIGAQKMTCAPLAPPAVAGVMNLRGRIVTAIDMRCCLKQEPREDEKNHMGIVVEREGELYSLMIDKVGDVLTLSKDTFETSPTTLDPEWRAVSNGIHKLEDEILVLIDIERLLEKAAETLAA